MAVMRVVIACTWIDVVAALMGTAVTARVVATLVTVVMRSGGMRVGRHATMTTRK